MADSPISGLPVITSLAGTDLIVAVDVSGNTTSQITVDNSQFARKDQPNTFTGGSILIERSAQNLLQFRNTSATGPNPATIRHTTGNNIGFVHPSESSVSAQILPSGTTLDVVTGIVTREKGDFRYTLQSDFDALEARVTALETP